MVCSFKQKRTKLNIQNLVVNYLTVDETQDICNGLNSFFKTIGEKLVDELVKRILIGMLMTTRSTSPDQLSIVYSVNQLLHMN